MDFIQRKKGILRDDESEYCLDAIEAELGPLDSIGDAKRWLAFADLDAKNHVNWANFRDWVGNILRESGLDPCRRWRAGLKAAFLGIKDTLESPEVAKKQLEFDSRNFESPKKTLIINESPVVGETAGLSMQQIIDELVAAKAKGYEKVRVDRGKMLQHVDVTKGSPADWRKDIEESDAWFAARGMA